MPDKIIAGPARTARLSVDGKRLKLDLGVGVEQAILLTPKQALGMSRLLGRIDLKGMALSKPKRIGSLTVMKQHPVTGDTDVAGWVRVTRGGVCVLSGTLGARQIKRIARFMAKWAEANGA